MTDTEANAADAARAREIERQEIRVRSLQFDVARAKANTQECVNDLHETRLREEKLRHDLLVAEEQLWHLRHPAMGITVGVNIHDPERLTNVLGEHMDRALADADQGRQPAGEAAS